MRNVFWTIHLLFSPTTDARAAALAATVVQTVSTVSGLDHRGLMSHVLCQFAAVETPMLRNTRTQTIISWPLPCVPLPPWNFENLFKIPKTEDIHR